LKKLQAFMTAMVEEHERADTVATAAEVTASPPTNEHRNQPMHGSVLPVSLSFAPTALVAALRYCLAFSNVMRESMNPQAFEALSREETGWHYMNYLVFAVNKRRTVSRTGGSMSPAEGDYSASAVSEFVVDVYLSAGAAFRSEVASPPAQDVMANAQLAPHAESLARSEEGNADSFDAFTPLAQGAGFDGLSECIVDNDQPVRLVTIGGSAERTVDQGPTLEARGKRAIGHLSHVSPMLRVWRISVAEFGDIVAEMETIAQAWQSAN
jgi:hypothetical protein